jgi:hypothetical protein
MRHSLAPQQHVCLCAAENLSWGEFPISGERAGDEVRKEYSMVLLVLNENSHLELATVDTKRDYIDACA